MGSREKLAGGQKVCGQERAPGHLNPEDIYSLSMQRSNTRRQLPFDILAQMEKPPERLNPEEIRLKSILNKPVHEPLIKDIQMGKPPDHLNVEEIEAIAKGKVSTDKPEGVKTSLKIEDTMCGDFLGPQEISDRMFNRKTRQHDSTFYSP